MAISEEGNHGRISLPANTPTKLYATPNAINDSVLVYAATGNAAPIYIGFSSGLTTNSNDATDGFPIAPGAAISIPFRRIDNIWVRSASSGNLWFIAL